MEAAAAWALELEQEEQEEQELEQEEQELEQEEQDMEQNYWQEELVRKKRAASTTNNYIHVSKICLPSPFFFIKTHRNLTEYPR